jgi:two-component system nitrogen regulation sensor histidine kinase NtrY
VLEDEKGTFLGLVGVFEDHTELIRAQRIAAWREVARRIAHEIKNPLTPILLAVQQIKNKYDGADERYQKLVNDSVEIVTEEVGGLRRMVEEFSAFAKLPNAKFETGEINTFINEFLAKHAFFDGQIKIDWQRDEKETILQFDRLLMERVLYNIIENAIHATVHRELNDRKLVIETQLVEDGDRFRISFSDNGTGISNEDKPRIFDPYFTTKPEGTGLGLAIVKKIVLEHGGKLDVEDNPAGGARFIIELPMPG